VFTDNAPVACPSDTFPAFSNEAAYDDHDVGKGDVDVNPRTWLLAWRVVAAIFDRE
jgi:hypothetical protein